MARSRRLEVKIGGDARQFQRAVRNANLSADLMGRAIAGAGRLAIRGFESIVTGAIRAAPAVVNMAGELELLNRKADIVFGDQLPKMKRWASEVGATMGMGRTETLGAAAGFADLLIPMGFVREEAADMAQQVVGLSGALSEWSGGSRTAAEVAQILGKAMLGERESLKELGISILQAEVNTRALEVAQKAGRTEVTKMDEAVASQQLIMEKSLDAQAAYAEGADTIARKWSEMRARLTNIVETVLTEFSPHINSALDMIVTRLEAWAPEVEKWVGEAAETFSDGGFAALWDEHLAPKVEEAFGAFALWMRNEGAEMLVGAAIDVGKAIGAGIVQGIADGLLERSNSLMNTDNPFWGGGGNANGMIDSMAGLIEGITGVPIESPLDLPAPSGIRTDSDSARISGQRDSGISIQLNAGSGFTEANATTETRLTNVGGLQVN